MFQENYIDNLFVLTGNGLASGLRHIKKRLAMQGNPHESLRVFHIAGTNGKGSVSQMLSQVLWKQFDKKVGIFLSPHLVDITERIQINGVPIPRETMNVIIEKVYQETKDVYSFSYFEILTLVAIQYFLNEGIDVAVFETGLGGTSDSTNIWKNPLATIITSIGSDHTRLLGPSLTQIQWNKMGIMKPGVPCYTAVDNRLMYEGARRKKALLHIITHQVPTNLPGKHQEQNAALVYHCLRDLGYNEKSIKKGLLAIEHPGRLQYLHENILLDGAHNAAGIQALQAYIHEIQPKRKKIITLFGSSKTLDELRAFSHLLLVTDENWLVQPSVHRGLDPHMYVDVLAGEKFQIAENVSTLLPRIIDSCEKDTLVLVYGSLYLVGEVLALEKSGVLG